MGSEVAVADTEDAAIGAVPDFDVTVVAGLGIDPVGEEEGTIGGEGDGDADGAVVVGKQKVGAVAGDVGRAVEVELFADNAVAVEVVEEGLAAVFGREGVGEVEGESAVGVAAAEVVSGSVAGALPGVVTRSIVVTVVGDFGEFDVGVGVEVLPCLPDVATALDDVEEVGDDTGADEEVTVLVEVETPGVAGTVGIDFEFVPSGVVAPDGGVEGDALIVGSAGFADFGVGEDAVAAVEPAVGTPGEAVEGFVGVLVAPAIEEDGGFGVREVVVVGVGVEEEVGSGADVNAAETDGESTGEVDFVGEDFAGVEGAVGVGVFEDEDAVEAFLAADGVGVAFDDPEAAF